MLERLLEEIRASGVADPARLAARLNVSPSLVQAMLEHLARQGRLKEVTACALSAACQACAGAACARPTCGPSASGPSACGAARAWVLAPTRPLPAR